MGVIKKFHEMVPDFIPTKTKTVPIKVFYVSFKVMVGGSSILVKILFKKK